MFGGNQKSVKIIDYQTARPFMNLGCNYIHSTRNKRNLYRKFIASITKVIKKFRWPRVQHQFYVGPGVDWE